MIIARRAWMLGTAATLACTRRERGEQRSQPPPPQPPPTSSNARLLQWDLGQQPWGEACAAVAIPNWGGAQARFPVLVALHGRGESLKRPSEGAMGWPRDYAMLRAIDRLRAPPLREEDYEGFVDPSRMAQENAALAAKPFGGVIVACPWLPDFDPRAPEVIASYSHFLVDDLLPRVRAQTPAIASAESTGIDGVSLGGVIALRIGLARPEAFGAVGGLQPAIREGQNSFWSALAQSARARRPEMKLRLLTSHEDYFRGAIIGVSRAWTAAGIEHEFADVPGPHDYAFNRGPGSIELLLWNDRVLARS